jgi:septum site-determining protein MinD
MTRIIAVASGKGGAGKTTVVANLGIALAKRGLNIVVVDANLTTPNLGLHLGVPLYPLTLHDVLKGKATVHDATYQHESGLKIIPAGLSMKDLRGVDARELSNSLLDLLGNTDMVIIDVAAGLGREALAAFESADEALIVANPELTSVTDALKAIKMAEQVGTKVSGVVINKVNGRPHEMTREEIISMLESEIIAEIPEENIVKEAISKRVPVVHHRPAARSSQEINKLAARLIGDPIPMEAKWYEKFISLLRKY